MALKNADLFVVRDSGDGNNKKVTAQALSTFVTGGATIQAVEGAAGITVATVTGTATVSADINTNRGLVFTGTGDTRQLAVALGDGLQFNASGEIEATNQALHFAGNIDLTDPATLPAGAVEVGDTYINVGNGNADATWAANADGLTSGDAVAGGDMVVCNTAGTGAAAQYTYVNTGGGGGGIQSVNLSEGNATATTADVVNDAGDDATLTAAVAGTRAGLLTAADKTKLDGITLDLNGDINEVTVNLSRARTATTNTVECDKGDNALLTAAEPSASGAGGFAGLMTGVDKEKLDGIGTGAQVVSVTANTALTNSGTATEVVLDVDFGPTPGGTPVTVMPYDISLLSDI